MKTTKSPTLEAYSELQTAYDIFNAELFDGKLPQCLITLQRQAKCMGYFYALRFAKRTGQTTDEIALNPECFGMFPILEVLQTLVHEMAHQWQHHFGKTSRKGYHNEEWADKMESVGLMPSSTGKPGGKRVGQKVSDYTISGGKFEKVALDLIAREFTVWFDRFPQRKPGTLDPESLIAALGDEEAEAEAPGEPKKPTRLKFVCPVCAAAVWGKPSTVVLCGSCEGHPAYIVPE